jgi:hypothetical protein
VGNENEHTKGHAVRRKAAMLAQPITQPHNSPQEMDSVPPQLSNGGLTHKFVIVIINYAIQIEYRSICVIFLGFDGLEQGQ